MSVRRVKTRTTDNGSSYYSYHLVDSYRVADRVRQRTLPNLVGVISASHVNNGRN